MSDTPVTRRQVYQVYRLQGTPRWEALRLAWRGQPESASEYAARLERAVGRPTADRPLQSAIDTDDAMPV